MRFKTLLIILLALLLPTAAVVAMTMAAGTASTTRRTQESLVPNQVFTYQGELLNDDVPEPGPCDFQFGLWDDLASGSQLGVTQTLNSVPLYDGRFTVQLNDSQQFGINSFDGSSRYLAIAVVCPSGSSMYVPLSPRQPLTPAPYSYYASSAGSAPWTGILSMPDGFADGIDDDTLYDAGTGLELISATFQLLDSYQLPQGCDPDQLVEWTGSTWGCVTPDSGGTTDYGYVVVVAKSGGAFETIQGALDSITDAGADNRYLVWVAPGVYSETVDMISYVDIEGAGRNLTKIQAVGSTSEEGSTVEAAEHSQLRYLTVENTGGNTLAIGIHSVVDDFSVLGVNVVVSGATSSNRGIRFYSGGILNRVEETTISVDVDGSSSPNWGLQFHASTGLLRLFLDDVTINVTGDGWQTSYGIYQGVNAGRTGMITATNISISVENSGTQPGSTSYGIYTVGAGASLSLANSSVYGSSSEKSGYAIFGTGIASLSMRNMNVAGSTGGVYASGSTITPTVRIDSSAIRGGASSISSSNSEIYCGACLLDGAYSISAGGSLVCVASYDENYSNTNGYTACP